MIYRPNYIVRLGEAIDALLNVVLLNGNVGETISLHAALAQQAGERWGCILCRVLNAVVERHHCRDQIMHVRGGAITFIRAAVAIGALLWVMWRIAVAISGLF